MISGNFFPSQCSSALSPPAVQGGLFFFFFERLYCHFCKCGAGLQSVDAACLVVQIVLLILPLGLLPLEDDVINPAML